MDYNVVLTGTDGVRYPLGNLAEITGLKYSTAWSTLEGGGGGCARASWQMALPQSAAPAWLRSGAWVSVTVGPVEVWGGYLSEVAAGPLWEFAAQGPASQARGMMAMGANRMPSSNVRVAVTEAIGMGLPWSTTLPDAADLPDASLIGGDTEREPAIHRLTELLGAVCETLGLRWAVWSDGILRVAPDPTTPTFLARGLDPVAPTADDAHVTHLHVRYIADMTGNPPEILQYGWTVVGDSTVAPSQRVFEIYDLAPTMSEMLEPEAKSIAENRLALIGPRTGWTKALELGVDNLSNIDGVPSHPALLEAGQMLRVSEIYTPEQSVDFLGHADIVIAETEFTAETETVRVTPMGMDPRSVRDVLTAVIDPKMKKYIDDWARDRSWLEEYVQSMTEMGIEKLIPGVSAPWPWDEP